MREPKTIVQAIKPILVMNFISGLAVFELSSNKLYKILEYAYTVLCLVALNGINRYSVSYFKEYFVSSAYELTQAMFKTIFYSNEVVMSILIITTRINAKKMKTVIALIDSCDHSMENMGMPKHYRKLFLNQIVCFLLCGMFISIFSFAVYNWHFRQGTPVYTKLMLTSIAHAPLLLVSICDISFCFWVNYLDMKFKQLNEFLRGMSTASSDSPHHKKVQRTSYEFENKSFRSTRHDQARGISGNAKTMRAVKQLHLELIKIARVVNSMYGMQILLLTTTSFIFSTGLLYLSYRLIWLNLTTNEFLHEMVTTFCWIIAYASKIFYMNHACAKTSAEATIAGDIICELYEPSTSREFRAEIRDFTLQLIQNPLVFTACGFFDMDHAFIQGVVGSITTYLVILIQVGDMTS